MKQFFLIGFTIATISLVNTSHADYTFYSNDPQTCQFIPGLWSGTGVAYNWLIGSCVYNGTIKAGSLDNAGNFIMDMDVNKTSGSFICPNHPTTQLSGVCVDGVVTIKTNYGNLAGHFSQNTGDAKGTLSITSGISVDLMIQFQRDA